MVKILLDKYPVGTYKGQKTPGKFMDGYLYENLRILGKRIVDDMTFMGVIFSSTLEVGTGKSVLATQIGEAWSEIIKKEHNIDVPFTINNIVWRPKDLIKRSFELPKYSCILLDEWEDASYWSELGMSLRQFFRKCRQLNLLMLVIIPNWFQLNINYAVSRSTFAIDVRFNNNFERGFFGFYNFRDKRMLYILGKKTHNYKCCRNTFHGRFINGYGVDENKYREYKMRDMIEYDNENPKKKTVTDAQAEIMQKIMPKFDKIQIKEWAEILNISPKTLYRWKNRDIEGNSKKSDNFSISQDTYVKKLSKDRIDWSDGEKLQESEKNEEKEV